MAKNKTQSEIDNLKREEKLTEFKKNFQEKDPTFAEAVKKLCTTSEDEDDPYLRQVAGLLISNKDAFIERFEYLAIMTSEDHLGRTSKQRKSAGHRNDEGPNKLRGVLGIVMGAS